jgi:hypothetical protein
MPTQFDGPIPPQSVRAKFFVSKVEFYSPTSRYFVLKPVYSENPEHENKSFWEATPSGELSMNIQNPRASEFFHIGEEYYVDFHAALAAPYAASQILPPSLAVDRFGKCDACGGEKAEIRGRTPQDGTRVVCPTCLAEKLNDIALTGHATPQMTTSGGASTFGPVSSQG